MRTGAAVLKSALAATEYKSVLRRLDARAVLDHYGAEHEIEMVNKDGTSTEVVHSCLLDRVERHHRNSDAHPSASCNLDRKSYVCYFYWGGDLLQLIMKMEGMDSVEQVFPFINEQGMLEGVVREKNTFITQLEKVFADSGPPLINEIPSYSERILNAWAFVHPWLEERGIDDDTAARWQIGWDEQDNRITIPHFWRGKLVGWQKRAVPPRTGEWPGTATPLPKYRSTSGFPKGDTLFGYDRAVGTGPVIVVESPMSVVKASALGLEIPVVATFGAKVSKTQLSLLRDFDEIVVWFDDDTAGRVGERRIVQGLKERERFSRVRVVNPEPGRDLGDYSDVGQVEAMLSAAVPASLKLAEWSKR